MHMVTKVYMVFVDDKLCNFSYFDENGLQQPLNTVVISPNMHWRFIANDIIINHVKR